MGDLDDLSDAAHAAATGKSRTTIHSTFRQASITPSQQVHGSADNLRTVKTGFFATLGVFGGILVVLSAIAVIVLLTAILFCAGLGHMATSSTGSPIVVRPGSANAPPLPLIGVDSFGRPLVPKDADQAKRIKWAQENGFKVVRRSDGGFDYVK